MRFATITVCRVGCVGRFAGGRPQSHRFGPGDQVKALDIVVNLVLVPNNSKIQDAVDRAHLVEKRIAGKLAKGSFVLQAKGIIFDSSTDG
jgi:hypothetical protein